MKIASVVVVVVLISLAISSGVTKMMLMPQDVEFFGRYGFGSTLLMVYGAVQVIGGVLMVLRKTRVIGSLIVAITFFISLIVLLIDRNYMVSLITLLAIVMLAYVSKRSLPPVSTPVSQGNAKNK